MSTVKTRAKLIVGDLHLGEGKRLFDGSINLQEDFTVDSKFAELLDFYSKSFDEVELILNGNFFEMLKCRAVVDYPDIIFETYAVEMVNTIMDGHPSVIASLKRFSEQPGHSIVYILGEADVGVLWPKVQDSIKARISDRIKFTLGPYLDRGVHVEHGHRYEPMYDISEEAAFREVNGLQTLQLPWGAFFNAHFIQPLRTLRPQFYRVRPMKNYLTWAFLFETRFLFRVLWQFLKMLFKASAQKHYPGRSFWTIFQIFRRGAGPEVLEEKAEKLLLQDGIQKVVFGYMHLASYRQFFAGKEYFNAGTWARHLSLDLRSLGSFHRLTYVLVEFASDSEPRARLMEWFGRHEVIEDYF